MVKDFKFSRTASAKLQQRINISIILNYLRNNDPKSRSEISRDLKISAPAVSRVIENLKKRKYVQETKKVKTESGKRPTPLKINGSKGFVIGIDLGKERIRIAVLDINGKVLEKYDGFKILNKPDIGDRLIKEINSILDDSKEKKNLYPGKLLAVCVGIPAQIDIETGKILGQTFHNSWIGLNLKELLNSQFNIPIYIENDVNLSALGEKYHSRDKKLNNFIFIEISKGIGAGLIIDDHLFRGSSGSAGEIGYSIIGKENFNYKIKDKGYLEKFASVESIKKVAIKKINDGEKSKILSLAGGNIKMIEPQIVFNAAIAEDKLAKKIIKDMVDLLSIRLINLILTLNPNIIIIGGEICKLPLVDKLFLEPLTKRIKETITFKVPEIKISALLEDAGVIGASFQAIETLVKSEFPYEIG